MLRVSIAFALVAGCGGAPQATEAPRGEETLEVGLVWLSGERDETHVVSPLTGEPIGEPLPGGHVALGEELWAITEEPLAVTLRDCEEIVDEGSEATLENPGSDETEGSAQAEIGEGSTLSLIAIGRTSASRRVLVEAPAPPLVRGIEHTLRVVALVGPYLFVEHGLWVDGCGAHGSEQWEAEVFDLRGGQRARVAIDTPILEELAELARDRLVEAGSEAGIEPSLDTGEVAFAALEPSWGEQGLRLQARFTTFACYACGDGEWSSYTRSTRVEVIRPPSALVPHEHLPAWVQAARLEAPDLRLVGFSVASGDAARAALAR